MTFFPCDRFVFLLERWLAVEQDDGQVERIIPVAGGWGQRDKVGWAGRVEWVGVGAVGGVARVSGLVGRVGWVGRPG